MKILTFLHYMVLKGAKAKQEAILLVQFSRSKVYKHQFCASSLHSLSFLMN